MSRMRLISTTIALALTLAACVPDQLFIPPAGGADPTAVIQIEGVLQLSEADTSLLLDDGAVVLVANYVSADLAGLAGERVIVTGAWQLDGSFRGDRFDLAPDTGEMPELKLQPRQRQPLVVAPRPRKLV